MVEKCKQGPMAPGLHLVGLYLRVEQGEDADPGATLPQTHSKRFLETLNLNDQPVVKSVTFCFQTNLPRSFPGEFNLHKVPCRPYQGEFRPDATCPFIMFF